MAGSVALAFANAGGRVAWVAATYKNSRPLWRMVERFTAPVADRVDVRRTDRQVVFPSGGDVGIYTADNPVGILGEDFDLVIGDEAARWGADVWAETILPTLADRNGRAMLISTPRGRNWFWREWMRGVIGQDGYASFNAPSSDNPSPNIRRAAAQAKGMVSDRIYRQEWLAEFVEDGGGVFRGVRKAATAVGQASATDGHAYVFGVDWARSHDYTVITCVDATTRELVALDRFTGIGYDLQLGRLRAMFDRFKPYAIIAESNSMGRPLIEQLNRTEMPVKAFDTTNASKASAIDALALAFERDDIHILNDATLINELEAYDQETLPSGAIRYGAPDGMHDDCVMSLALCWTRAKRSQMLVG